MSPKLLQKTSNRFLQLSPPENLIPNKRLGKREKNRSRRPVMDHSRVEGELCRQWVFSWNTLKKRMQQQEIKSLASQGTPRKTTGRESIKLPVSLAETAFPAKESFFLITPGLHLVNERIGRAVGGNITAHLNEYVKNVLPITHEKVPAFQGLSSNRVNGWYRIPEDREKRFTAADTLAQQIDSRFFHMIYSLGEKGKTRRDKINDEYKNQLAECRKISFLYGNLQKKTLIRTMGRAKEYGGDVDSCFFSLLERRLDVALKRAFFFSTIKQARQWIQRGKILVNNQPITISSYLLQPADFITITPRARLQWKKHSLLCIKAAKATCSMKTAQNPVHRFPSTFVPEKRHLSFGNSETTTSEHFVTKERRFPFSPVLMRKWKEWSQLWSNSLYPYSTGHKWGTMKQPSAMVTNSLDFLKMQLEFSSSSAFAAYLSAINSDKAALVGAPRVQGKKNEFLLRRETTISNWLRAGAAVANQKRDSTGKESPSVYTKQAKGNLSRLAPRLNAEGKSAVDHFNFFTNPFPLAQEKKISCQWLHQQQSAVLDGLYSLRWNRVFAARKSLLEKKGGWRWSCIKPMHLECSYKHCTILFLYSPQKLAWPSSINVFLLRKALGG